MRLSLACLLARRVVRRILYGGADLIKLMPSGGIASTGDNPRAQLMTNEEMRVAVETAHSLGMKVAAHIYPAGAIENARKRRPDTDPTELIADGWQHARSLLERHIEGGLSKFVIRPVGDTPVDEFIDRFIDELLPRQN